MKARSFTLGDVARIVGGKLEGDAGIPITGAAGIETATEGDITFVADPRYEAALQSTLASAVIARPGVSCPRPVIRCENPYLGFVEVLTTFADAMAETYPQGVHESAVVDSSAELGENTSVGPFCWVGPGVKIGDNSRVVFGCFVGRNTVIGDSCLIYPNVTIREECRVGDRVTIHPGAVIGGDGFGYTRDGVVQRKIPQIGKVVLENDVEIGSNTTIDRATTGVTRIGEGTKIDNLVQVGHNVVIGKNCVLAGQAGIAGSSELGDGVVMAGQTGIADHLSIGDGAVIAAKSAATKSIPPGMVVSGAPAREHSRMLKLHGYTGRIPVLMKKITALEKRLSELEKGKGIG